MSNFSGTLWVTRTVKLSFNNSLASDNAGAVTKEPSKSEIPVRDMPSTTVSEQIQMARVKAVESLETLDTAAVADLEIVMEKQSANDIMDSLDPGHTSAEIKTARAEAVESLQTPDTAAVGDPEIALEKQPVDDIIDSLDPGPQPSVGIEGVEVVQSLQTLDTAPVANPEIALDKEVVDDTMDSLDPGPIPLPPVGIETIRMEAVESVEALDTAAVVDPEIAIEKHSVDNGIVDDKDSGPMSGASVEIMDTETAPKDRQDRCATSEPVKRSNSRTRNKTMKGSLQPVRSSRRLRQLGLLESDKRAVSTVISVETTHKTMVGTSTSKGGVDVGSTHVEQVTRVSEEITRADNTSMGSPPVELTDSGDVEPVNQGIYSYFLTMHSLMDGWME